MLERRLDELFSKLDQARLKSMRCALHPCTLALTCIHRISCTNCACDLRRACAVGLSGSVSLPCLWVWRWLMALIGCSGCGMMQWDFNVFEVAEVTSGHPLLFTTCESARHRARLGSARLGSARLGSARLGSARLG